MVTKKPEADVVCARIALNSILVQFGHNKLVDSTLRLLDAKEIAPTEAIQWAMELQLIIARKITPVPGNVARAANQWT